MTCGSMQGATVATRPTVRDFASGGRPRLLCGSVCACRQTASVTASWPRNPGVTTLGEKGTAQSCVQREMGGAILARHVCLQISARLDLSSCCRCTCAPTTQPAVILLGLLPGRSAVAARKSRQARLWCHIEPVPRDQRPCVALRRVDCGDEAVGRPATERVGGTDRCVRHDEESPRTTRRWRWQTQPERRPVAQRS